MPDRVNKTMDVAVQQQIITHLQSAKNLLGTYLVSKKQLGSVSGANMGTGNAVQFVQKAFNIVVSNPEIMEGLYKRDPFDMDINYYIVMKPIVDEIVELNKAVGETFILLGHDLMEQAHKVLLKLRSASEEHGGKYATLYADLNTMYENRAKLSEDTKANNLLIAELTAKVAQAEGKAK